ncbi:MAG: hypothetical protein KGK33_04540 [Hyphomicrobiales bacterium]|nr:hypothetical protein [Hyphomicrobiales bacterium]
MSSFLVTPASISHGRCTPHFAGAALNELMHTEYVAALAALREAPIPLAAE